MSDPPADNAPSDAAILRSMALLATLSTAATVAQAAAERRAGRDPSAQEAEPVARPLLRQALREAHPLLLRMQAALAYLRHQPEDRLPLLVRQFDLLLTLTRTARLLQTIHQRLLSLYPAIPAELAEEARQVQAAAEAQLAEDEADLEALTALVERTLVLLAWTDGQLG